MAGWGGADPDFASASRRLRRDGEPAAAPDSRSGAASLAGRRRDRRGRLTESGRRRTGGAGTRQAARRGASGSRALHSPRGDRGTRLAAAATRVRPSHGLVGPRHRSDRSRPGDAPPLHHPAPPGTPQAAGVRRPLRARRHPGRAPTRGYGTRVRSGPDAHARTGGGHAGLGARRARPDHSRHRGTTRPLGARTRPGGFGERRRGDSDRPVVRCGRVLLRPVTRRPHRGRRPDRHGTGRRAKRLAGEAAPRAR